MKTPTVIDLELELDVITPNNLAEKKINPETGEAYLEKGDEILTLQFKPVHVRKAEFQHLMTMFKDWTLTVEAKRR